MYELNVLLHRFIEDLNYGLSKYHLSHPYGYVKTYSIDTWKGSLETRSIGLTFCFII